MITEIIFFDLPAGTARNDAVALYRKTAGKWAANPDLIEKYYFFDGTRNLGGGVYVWPDREAAQRWHGEEYELMVEQVYGARPRIQILDALIHIDPKCGRIEEL